MSLMVPRRHLEDERPSVINDELARELSAAAAKEFTGAIEVLDRATRNRARVYLYEGGLYAIDLEGYPPSVFARLRTAGVFAKRSSQELAILANLDVPDAAVMTHAVDAGWLTIEMLAGVHQELLLASLGSVLALPKVKTRPRKGLTTAEFCTMPLPVEPLFDTVRMRADRMQGTWSMLAPGTEPGQATLARTLVPADGAAATAELTALARGIDSGTCLDAVASSLGFTRAEAVHVASGLVRAGMARVVADPPEHAEPSRYLVPEAFGSHQVVPVVPARVPPLQKKSPTPTPTQVPSERAMQLPTVPPARPVSSTRVIDDVEEREVGLERARADVQRLHTELQVCVRAEQEAINATAEVSQRLRDARVTLANLEMTEGAGIL